MQMMGKEKPIWRLAFFSRLEERKGIKLFVEAVSSLNVTNEKFEVRIHDSDHTCKCVFELHI
jgi:glycosyltransferase involved in cell wall biosynthesis